MSICSPDGWDYTRDFVVSNKREFARSLRREMTDAERHLWRALRQRSIDGFKFRRQHVIGEFVVDFVCLERMLVLEIDGGQHAEAVQYDESRSASIKRDGFRVLRFWNNEILENLEGVLEVISQALREMEPPV